MRLYDTTFILSPQADDAAFDRQIKAVHDVISRYEGKVVRENRWGIRRLAYPIRRFTQGFYTRMIFEGNNKVLSELERFFKIEEPYIRYLTVSFEGDLEEEINRASQEAPAAAVIPSVVPIETKPIEKVISVEPIKPEIESPKRGRVDEKPKYDDDNI